MWTHFCCCFPLFCQLKTRVLELFKSTFHSYKHILCDNSLSKSVINMSLCQSTLLNRLSLEITKRNYRVLNNLLTDIIITESIRTGRGETFCERTSRNIISCDRQMPWRTKSKIFLYKYVFIQRNSSIDTKNWRLCWQTNLHHYPSIRNQIWMLFKRKCNRWDTWWSAKKRNKHYHLLVKII